MSGANWAIAIHGGAGVIERAAMTAEREAEYRASLSAILESAVVSLRAGASALDVVESAVRLFEDDPLFNAGRGAVFSAEGRIELDASVMDGATLGAGAVANVSRVRHPISLARAVMQQSRHVMLAGPPADAFAQQRGLEMVHPSFFFTERRWAELEKILMQRGQPVPPRPASAPQRPEPAFRETAGELPSGGGTVGAVALDCGGNVAAATSTGGMTGKLSGRVGDSAIIGAGTYASNRSCAVSGTGDGEFFIRLGVARQICDLIECGNHALQPAVDEVILRRLAALGGSGGVIAVSSSGAIAWSFNTPGMYRAKASATTSAQISIFGDES